MRTFFRILVMSILVSINGTILAQQCFDKNWKKGQTTFNNQQYKEAKRNYQAAFDCPDANSAKKKQAMAKIKECEELIKKSKDKPAKPDNGRGKVTEGPIVSDKVPDKEPPVQNPPAKEPPVRNDPAPKPPVQTNTDNSSSSYFTIDGSSDSVGFLNIAYADDDGDTVLVMFTTEGCRFPTQISYSPSLPDWIRSGSEAFYLKRAVSENKRTWSGTASCPGCKNSIHISVEQNGIPPAKPEARMSESGISYGYKDLNLHTNIQYKNLKGKKVAIYMQFYQEDGVTPLRNKDGEWIMHIKTWSPRSNDEKSKKFDHNFNKTEILINATSKCVRWFIGVSLDEGKTWLSYASGSFPIL